MSETCAVVIAAADVLPALKERTAAVNGEVLTFPDTEAVRALDAIIKRRPHVLRIERMFASTPRGAALINRIKADPGLVHMEIEVVAHDTDYSRVVRQGAPASDRASTVSGPPSAATVTSAAAAVSARAPAPILAPPPVAKLPMPLAPPAARTPILQPTGTPDDRRGTREASRFRMEPGLEIMVDGNSATLVDLSTVGAQVISTAALKPNQRVRLAFTDDVGNVRLSGAVAWASFEITKNGARYRAGIQFVKPDEQAIEAFCGRHKA